MLFPETIGFSKVEPSSNAPAYVSESQSLKTIATGTDAQRWELTLTTTNLNEKNFRLAWAFLNSLGGKYRTFSIKLPLFNKPLGEVSGEVRALASYGIGDDSITLENYAGEMGDFIRFSGHDKTYQITEVAGSSLAIYPALINSVTAAEVVSVSDFLFNARLNSSLSKLAVPSNTRLAQIKFSIIEAF